MSETALPTGQRDLVRLRHYTWWLLTPYPLLAAGVGAVQVLRQDRSSALLVAVLASFALATVVSVRWFDAVTRHRGRAAIGRPDWIAFAAAVAGLAATAVAAAPFDERPLGWAMLAGALSGALVLRLRPRLRFPGLAAMTAATGGLAAAIEFGSTGRIALPGVSMLTLIVASIAGIIWAQWWSLDVARQLERARGVAAELAVARERLRFAAELHDIQGHHLQVIALKSELAARLNDKRTEAATALMREVQELARDALSDTRAVVAGYRRVSVRTEITNAVKVLTAAGIRVTARLPPDDPRWDARVERELGLLIREATTNMLRHAKPARADVELSVADGTVTVRIGNDGAGPRTAGSDPDGRRPADTDGTGLAGLRDRYTAAGGRVEFGRDGDEFTVAASLPLPAANREGAERP